MTNIIFDLALHTHTHTHTHIYIYIIHAEYLWLVMAGLKEMFCTLVLKFVYIYQILFTVGTTNSVEAADFDGIDLILW